MCNARGLASGATVSSLTLALWWRVGKDDHVIN